jgi:hypothetical protein
MAATTTITLNRRQDLVITAMLLIPQLVSAAGLFVAEHEVYLDVSACAMACSTSAAITLYPASFGSNPSTVSSALKSPELRSALHT